VRIAIVNGLGQLRSPDALPTLLELLHDQSTTVRSVAARAIGAIGTGDVIPRLVDVAASDRMMVRTAAVDAIARIGGTSSIEQLSDLRRRSRDPVLRRYLSVELKKLREGGKTGREPHVTRLATA
jgi:HEAT repeat protein